MTVAPPLSAGLITISLVDCKNLKALSSSSVKLGGATCWIVGLIFKICLKSSKNSCNFGCSIVGGGDQCDFSINILRV